MTESKKIKLKIIIVGEPAVGKTSLVKKFVSGHFSKDYRSSIGTDIYTKNIILEDKTPMTLQLWDIAGQERWINMRHSYYLGAKGVIIVGDLTRKITFDQIEKFWIQDIKQYCSVSPIILLANKHDLSSNLKKQDIVSLGKRINAESILFTSAKTGEKVEAAFKLISEQGIKYFQ
ncbi:MAG: Rab family GTPase [Promethearchaeota archaeon]